MTRILPRPVGVCLRRAIAGGVASAICALGTAASASTIRVPAGSNLQAALDAAQPGDTIALDAGATYTGNFTLPVKGGATFITVTSAPAGQPAAGTRVGPADAGLLAKIQSPDNTPALRTAPGAHHWALVLLEFRANAGGAGDIIQLGDGSGAQSSLAQVPHDLVVDRCYIHGDPAAGQKRGIALNSAATTISGSYIADIKAVGQDSQAICGWNGPGPYTIANNYLEAAGENIMFGGSDPAIPNLTPADIQVADNLIAKPTSWRGEAWSVKNLLELKNARRVTVERNVIEFNWQAGQAGWALQLTPRNQDGACPWCQVEQVTISRNIIRHVAAGISIQGWDDNASSLQANAIVIRDNVFSDIDSANWGGNGYLLQLIGSPRDITLDHNTVIQDHSSGILFADGGPVTGFVFTNNVARQGAFGIIGSDHAPGNDSIAAYLPGARIVANAIADAPAWRYPAGNFFPSSAEFAAQFVSYAEGDYRLTASSGWRRAGSDGLDLGASFDGAGSPPVKARPAIAIDTPRTGDVVPQPFVISGWAIDSSDAASTGIDVVQVYAYPSPGSGRAALFLGNAAYGAARADLAQAFGTRFAGAGFSLAVGGLAPGPYQIVAFAHSSVDGSFTPAMVTMAVGESTRLTVDLPQPGVAVRQPFAVAGWALDAAASTAPGVDAIQVWAYPDDGGAAVFVGGGTTGGARPDIGGAFGPQFATAGFAVMATGLPAGSYRLVVFARSVASGNYLSRVVPITVLPTATVTIDTPSAGGVADGAFTIAGWAVDTAARSGSGIAAVHVWAYPVGGGSPLFLGVADYGGYRPDIAALFGAGFGASGYGVRVGGIPRGTWDVAVFGLSAVTNTFATATVVRILQP